MIGMTIDQIAVHVAGAEGPNVADWIIAGFTAVLALSTIALWLATRRLWKSHDAGTETLVHVNRPLVLLEDVYFEGPEISNNGQTTPVRWRAVWKNYGGSAALAVSVRSAVAYVAKIEDVEDIPNTGPLSGPRRAIGAGQTSIGSINPAVTGPLPPGGWNLTKAIAAGRIILFFGAVEYLDQLFGTPRRTEFSYQVFVFGDPTKPGAIYRYEQIGLHNGTDADCKFPPGERSTANPGVGKGA